LSSGHTTEENGGLDAILEHDGIFNPGSTMDAIERRGVDRARAFFGLVKPPDLDLLKQLKLFCRSHSSRHLEVGICCGYPARARPYDILAWHVDLLFEEVQH
jgi:hypothetical protein